MKLRGDADPDDAIKLAPGAENLRRNARLKERGLGSRFRRWPRMSCRSMLYHFGEEYEFVAIDVSLVLRCRLMHW